MNAFDQLKNLYADEEDIIEKIDLQLINDYPEHPYSISEERVLNLSNSIKENGLISPIILRKKEDKYYILSGHHRKRAYELLNKDKIEAIIKTDITDREAEVLMLDSNLLQRSFADLSIMERARILALRYTEIKAKKKLDEKYKEETKGLKTKDILADEYDVSEASVRRYIQLTNLIEPLQELVDKGKISTLEAVKLSRISPSIQSKLTKLKSQNKAKLNLSKLNDLNDNMSIEEMKTILIKEKEEVITIKLPLNELKNKFPEEAEGNLKEAFLNWVNEKFNL